MKTAFKWFFIAAGCGALVGFFVLVRWALEQPLAADSKSVARPLEYQIASGMCVRYRHLSAESVSFRSCGRRRARMGAVIIGGFDVLELEDVCLNLPLPAEAGAVPPSAKKPADAARASRQGQLGGVLEKLGLSGVEDVFSVSVRGLRVGRMTETGVEPLFTARRVKTMWSGLCFFDCEVFRNGKRESVPEAGLEDEDGLRLVWPGGSLDLPDILEVRR